MSHCMFIQSSPRKVSKKHNISTDLSFCKNLFWTWSEPSWNDSMSLKQTNRNEVICWTWSLDPCQRALDSVQQVACSWMVSDRFQKNYPTHSGRVWGKTRSQNPERVTCKTQLKFYFSRQAQEPRTGCSLSNIRPGLTVFSKSIKRTKHHAKTHSLSHLQGNKTFPLGYCIEGSQK